MVFSLWFAGSKIRESAFCSLVVVFSFLSQIASLVLMSVKDLPTKNGGLKSGPQDCMVQKTVVYQVRLIVLGNAHLERGF